MPLIQVKVIEGVFSDEQKRDIIRKLTDAMVSVEGENMRSKPADDCRRKEPGCG
jgi:4-oxalocrotonate tautomerase